jgi:ribosomal protein S18 acetylase RimI-like enzyme
MSLFYTRFCAGVIIVTMNLTASSQPSGQARPLNILRDLSAVADLIEVCFKETMDSSGRSHLSEMRRHASDRVFLSWAPRMVDVISLPLSGFVWEMDGKVVGNASLIPFHSHGRRLYLIANVATHPDYRCRGIGRILTEMAMERAREKGANAIWLHVRDDNPGAIKIYHDLGFRERMRRTEWYASSVSLPEADNLSAGIKLRSRTRRDWELQRNWLARAYPADINWYHQQVAWSSLGPSLWDSLYRLFADIEVTQWAVESGGQLRGAVTCRYQGRQPLHTWLACPPNPDVAALTALLGHVRRMAAHMGGLHLEYPTGPADAAMRAAGFTSQRTLLWMEAPGQQPN